VKVVIIIIKYIICYISSIGRWVQTTKRPQKTTKLAVCSLSLVFRDARNFEDQSQSQSKAFESKN